MVQERLKRLEDHIRSLELFRARYGGAAIYGDQHLEWALRYGLLEAIQMVIDIACHLVNVRQLGAPGSYAECIDLLEQHGYLSPTLAVQLRGMIGLRNLLVHEYIDVDTRRLIGYLDQLDDFREFLREVQAHL